MCLMLAVVSDLHMTDRVTGSSVSDADLVALARELEGLQPRDEPLTLLLLGDIVDLLRSEQWDRLWEDHHGAAPWSAVGPDFVGFEGGIQEPPVLEIIKAIDTKYHGFFTALAALKAARPTTIQYVIGNHDFMLQLSRRAREEVVRLFHLDQPAAKPFPLEYLDETLDVYADHGHRHDDVNYHQWHQGRWALGDGIVLRVVNRFAALARKELHLTSTTDLGKAVDEIDNVDPHFDIPLYVKWLADTLLTSENEQQKLRDAWRDTVSAFLQLPDFQEKRYAAQATAIKWARTLYGLFDVNELSTHLRNIPFSLTRSGHIRQGHTVRTSAALRVFGHTHAPAVHPLPKVNGKRRCYVNTGTWRSSTARVVIEDPAVDFAAQRVSTLLVVRGPGDFELRRRSRCP
jgi:UDP-2,3-diacylglucosamine pyrophosphatase LpxH